MIKYYAFLLFTFLCQCVCAQDTDLFKMLESDSKKADSVRTDYTSATFKTTRLINGHTVENTGKGILDFKVSHRFGTLNKGAYELFGLDNATMRFGFDYGITSSLMVGIGRSTFEKQYDAFVKYKLLRQSSGRISMPVTVGLLSTIMVKTLKEPAGAVKTSTADRYSYTWQLLIGRKFSAGTSLQVMPVIVHDNIVAPGYHNDILAIGIGGRQKLSKRISINGEYYHVLPDYALPGTHNSLSLGFDIETGGHVFQLHFTNSTGMTERSFITETTGKWLDGDIHFGFNISRVFTIGKKRK